jgi:3-dehydroquinate synthase
MIDTIFPSPSESVVFSQHVSQSWTFPVCFTRDIFAPANATLAEVIARAGVGPHRLGVVVDQGLAQADSGLLPRLEAYVSAHGDSLRLAAPPLVVPGGEGAKADFVVVSAVWELTLRAGLCRQSFLLAIGGGAVLDAAGLAAATAHRGLRLVRLPSTVLAQNDAGVGLKNGINAFGRKNYLGCFAPPFAVVSDLDLLASLPPREARSGLVEAVKVGLVRDGSFFQRLQALAPRLAILEPAAVAEATVQCARLHLEHIAGGGDPFELGSARPLDFGHWAGHALEEATAGALRHGEAVAVGMALDSLYARDIGLFPATACEAVLSLLSALGLSLWHPALAGLDLAAAVEAFREHLGGALHLTLPTGIGSRVEVHTVDAPVMDQARADLARRFGG